MIVTVYQCDRAGCETRGESTSGGPPHGWPDVWWVPGIVKPHGLPEALCQPQMRLYCSHACRKADKPSRDAFQRQVHEHYRDFDRALAEACT